MRIVCLGWGSLIWDPRQLAVTGGWQRDGPLLAVEFTRISSDGRVTLIIDKDADKLPVLWADMKATSITQARQLLQAREGTKGGDIKWTSRKDRPDDEISEAIKLWTLEKGIDSVVWTGLSFSKSTNYMRPSVEEIIKHLKGLRGYNAFRAEEYIRRAPAQVATLYRAEIERALGWTPREN